MLKYYRFIYIIVLIIGSAYINNNFHSSASFFVFDTHIEDTRTINGFSTNTEYIDSLKGFHNITNISSET